MKTLTRLEKNISFWSILILGLMFFFLRLPSLIEPNWYGDEGIYQVIGMALQQGHILYSDIWDNKPPLLYVTYALFNGDQFMVRIVSLIVGILSTIIFFFLSQMLFQKLRTSIVTTLFFIFLFATPILEGNIANAENFILLPIITAGFLIYRTIEQQKKFTTPAQTSLLIAGFLLGIAFLFKIVAIFDLMAFLFFVFMVFLPKKIHFSRELFRPVFPLLIGFVVPFLLTTLYFLSNFAFEDFIQSTFFGNIGYVGYGNKFIIPQGLLILKALLLLGAVSALFWKRTFLSKPALFVLLWLVFALFDAFFSQRPYTHYVLVLLPSVCLLIGLIITTQTKKLQFIFSVLLLVVIVLVSKNFSLPSGQKTINYYTNFITFVTGKKDVTAYQASFDGKTPRDYALASFINSHTRAEDTIFLWGDSAQIYALSHKLPPVKYTVAYHIKQNKNGIAETQNALNKTQPKYIITLTEANPIPFQMSNYQQKFAITGATIYERNY